MPKKKFMFTESADLANFNYKGVYVSLTIDIRKWVVTKRDEAGSPIEHDRSQLLPIVLRITKESKRLYLPPDFITFLRHYIAQSENQRVT